MLTKSRFCQSNLRWTGNLFFLILYLQITLLLFIDRLYLIEILGSINLSSLAYIASDVNKAIPTFFFTVKKKQYVDRTMQFPAPKIKQYIPNNSTFHPNINILQIYVRHDIKKLPSYVIFASNRDVVIISFCPSINVQSCR